jgi:hypothetical protein
MIHPLLSDKGMRKMTPDREEGLGAVHRPSRLFRSVSQSYRDQERK